MIYVSMIEIFFKAKDTLTAELGEIPGYWATAAGFSGNAVNCFDRQIYSRTPNPP